MAVTSPPKRKRGTSSRERKPRLCWNCGEAGHFRDKCPKPKKARTTAPESAQAAQDSEDEAFGVSDADSMPDLESVSDSSESSVTTTTDADSMPSLVSVSDSSDSDFVSNCDDIKEDDGEDWFSDVDEDLDSPWGEGWETKELSGIESDCDSFLNVDLDSDVAAYVSTGFPHATHTELYDSGTTRHISPYREMFEEFTDIPPKTFNAANKQQFDAVGQGEMIIEVPNGLDASKLRLTEVLYSPEVGYTLVSIGQLDKCGYSATFANGKCIIRDSDGDAVGEIPKSVKGLYKIVHDESDSSSAATEKLTVMELHRRMGHISPGITKKLIENGLVTGVRLDDSSGDTVFCESCVYAKSTRKPVAKEREGEQATEFGEEVHSNLWGPAPVATIGGRRYYVTFTDDKTRMTYLHLLRRKRETLGAYKDFAAKCLTQHEAHIKTLHSDRGGKYTGKEFTLYLRKNGTKQKLTVHDTPQHNGVAERLNRTILEKVRAMLHASGQPKFLWARLRNMLCG